MTTASHVIRGLKGCYSHTTRPFLRVAKNVALLRRSRTTTVLTIHCTEVLLRKNISLKKLYRKGVR